MRLAVDPAYAGKTIEVRLDSTGGPLVGSITVPNTGGWTTFQTFTFPIQATKGVHNVVLVGKGGSGIANIDWIAFAKATQ